ncbi:MAG: carboxymuconolactone decarboxylase family protein [Dehalococcoidia bacterium]
MARIPYLSKADLKPEDQALLAREINLNRAMVNSPGASRAFGRLGGFIRNESTLDSRLREMAILQVGYLARSRYEYSHHIKIGRDFGVSDDDIRAIAIETAGGQSSLDALSRAVLRAAREMAEGPGASAETFAVLEGALSTEHVTDLCVTIAFYCGVVRLLATLEIDVEDEYLHYLDEFPLPS